MYHRLITKFTSVLIASLLSATAFAETTAQTRISKSISYSSQTETMEKQDRDQLLQQSKNTSNPTSSKLDYRMESVSLSLEISNIEYIDSHDFYIYDASSSLISDIDSDGFYHRFSINIDVDTYLPEALVYARLYLSYEGGPWEYFASSDNYLIYGDSAHDAFTIETELADGFPAGHYDIRIELYDGHTGHWILAYGPYNDSSLSVLPLEDSYADDLYIYDGYPVEAEIVVGARGSLHFAWLALPAILWFGRRYACNNQSSFDETANNT